MRMCERKVWRGIYWTVDIYMTLNLCVSIERDVEAYKPVLLTLVLGKLLVLLTLGKEMIASFSLYICVI